MLSSHSQGWGRRNPDDFHSQKIIAQLKIFSPLKLLLSCLPETIFATIFQLQLHSSCISDDLQTGNILWGEKLASDCVAMQTCLIRNP